MSGFEVVHNEQGKVVAIKTSHVKSSSKAEEVSPAILLNRFTTFPPGKDVPIRYVYYILGKLRAVLHHCEVHNSTFDEGMHAQTRTISRALFTDTVTGLGMPVSKPVSLNELRAFISLIEDTYEEEISAARERISTGSLTYNDLAELFRPGTEVIGLGGGLVDGMGFIVRSAHYEEEKSLFGPKLSFQVELEFIASVGDRFAVIRFQDLIGLWQNLRPISGLSYRPLLEKTRDSFTKRGEQYSRMANGVHHLHCSKGMFVSRQIQGASEPGKIMVDIAAAIDSGRKPICGDDSAAKALDFVCARYTKAVRQGRLDMSKVTDPSVQRDTSVGLLMLEEMCFLDAVPDDRLWNCWPIVFGYSFTAKSWGQAMIEGLSPITWQDQAWDKLVLPKDRKDLLQAVVKQQREVGNVDLIKGKGEGTTFLLYGPPGTGKTLTAEAMAEALHKPLYIMSAGEMGTTPETLEKTFSEALQLCARWDCLCLVDEADIFLEQRRDSDVLRNALVCVMLRLLEYHPGVMFLTTNRARCIDSAVQSRLTLALRYDPLDACARRQVWSNLLRQSDCSMFDLEHLAAAPLNGRQIMNCIRLSSALAMERGEPLSQQLLCSTLETVTSFQHDLQDKGERGSASSRGESFQVALQWALAAAHSENEALRAQIAALRAELGAEAAGSALVAIRTTKP